jgi:hypothetical protein
VAATAPSRPVFLFAGEQVGGCRMALTSGEREGSCLNLRVTGPMAGWLTRPQSTAFPIASCPAARVNILLSEQRPRLALRLLRGRIMTDQHHLAGSGSEQAAIRSCWLCGIRLSASSMVPDGGSACPDLRWYCRDTWACTQRWTSHAARLAAGRRVTAEPSKKPAAKAADVEARPVPV